MPFLALSPVNAWEPDRVKSAPILTVLLLVAAGPELPQAVTNRHRNTAIMAVIFFINETFLPQS
jgi:hypothetical protein